MRKKLLGVALPLSLLVVLCAAGPAFATHQLANVSWQVLRGSTSVAGPVTEQHTCNSTFCVVTLSLPNREYGRFQRWCDGQLDVIVPANAGAATGHCFGGGQWVLSVGAAFRSADGTQPESHPDPVTVRVVAVKQ